MTAPAANAAPGSEPDRGAPPAPPSVTPPLIETLKKRRDFLAAARARRWSGPGLLLQGRRRSGSEPTTAAIRVGYTCSKKVGNAVARNRAKRRLRAAAAEALPRAGREGWDYVLIGRAGATAARPFRELVGDLETALAHVHEPKRR